jgi:hypothetical protein
LVDAKYRADLRKPWLALWTPQEAIARQGHLPGRMNGEFHVVFGLAAITAAITRREWYHMVLAPAS